MAKENARFRTTPQWQGGTICSATCFPILNTHATVHVSMWSIDAPLSFGSNQFERHHCSRKPKTIMNRASFCCRFVSSSPAVWFFARLGRAFPEFAAFGWFRGFQKDVFRVNSKRSLLHTPTQRSL
jgi:hypothetical protein